MGYIPPKYQMVQPEATSPPHQSVGTDFSRFDVVSLKKQFADDNKRFQEANLDHLRARERSMLAELQSLQVKKDRIKRLKHQQNVIAERLRLEIKKHSWQQQ